MIRQELKWKWGVQESSLFISPCKQSPSAATVSTLEFLFKFGRPERDSKHFNPPCGFPFQLRAHLSFKRVHSEPPGCQAIFRALMELSKCIGWPLLMTVLSRWCCYGLGKGQSGGNSLESWNRRHGANPDSYEPAPRMGLVFSIGEHKRRGRGTAQW